MPGINFEGNNDGGTDIRISLTAHESAALGMETSILADWFDTVLYALVLLRTGETDRMGEMRPSNTDAWYTVINDLEYRLAPRLKGIRDAAIRAHKHDGGTLDHLALAMDVPKSTAQYRRNQVLHNTEDLWENWAVNGGPQNKRANLTED